MDTTISLIVIIAWVLFVAYIVIYRINSKNRNKRAINYLTLYLENNPGDVNALEDYKRSCKRLRGIFEKAVMRKDAKTAELNTIIEIFRKALLQKMEHEGELP